MRNTAKMFVFRLLQKILKDSRVALITYWEPFEAPVMSKVIQLRKEGMAQAKNEGFQLYMAAKNTQKVPGEIAEVGVYLGGTAKLFNDVRGNREMHLFDTFEGLPEKSIYDKGGDWLKKGDFFGSLEHVQAYLQGISNVYFHKGYFPDTTGPVKDKIFSLVHLDVDLYQPTHDGLVFFYPRMSKGGIIISHDYRQLPGVKKAFDDFFADKPEPLIEMSGSQVLVVKT